MTGMIDVDEAELDRMVDIMLTGILQSGTRAIAAQTRALEKDLEDLTKRNVKGKLWAAWGSESYPKGGRAAYDPVGEVYLNGRKRTYGAISYWTKPGINRNKSGGWLAIPTEAAGVLNRTRTLTPKEWEARHGQTLHYIDRGAGKFPVLSAEFVVFGSGTAVGFRNRNRQQNYVNKDGKRATRVMVPIFTLIPFQRFANKFSVDPTILRREKMLVEDFERRVRRLPKFAG